MMTRPINIPGSSLVAFSCILKIGLIISVCHTGFCCWLYVSNRNKKCQVRLIPIVLVLLSVSPQTNPAAPRYFESCGRETPAPARCVSDPGAAVSTAPGRVVRRVRCSVPVGGLRHRGSRAGRRRPVLV